MEHVHIGAGNGIPVLGETASPPLPIHTPADLGDDVQVQRMSSSSVGTALSLTNPATAMKDTVASSVRSRVTPNQAWHGRPSPDKLFQNVLMCPRTTFKSPFLEHVMALEHIHSGRHL
jgi:hypothetical protein